MIAMLLTLSMAINIGGNSSNAARDGEASVYGFYVDSDIYKKTVWNSALNSEKNKLDRKLTIICRKDNVAVGKCIVDVGLTRMKKSIR